MKRDDLIYELENLGFTYNDDYLTMDICFDYKGCRNPLIFTDWSDVRKFYQVLASNNEE